MQAEKENCGTMKPMEIYKKDCHNASGTTFKNEHFDKNSDFKDCDGRK